MLKKCLAKDPDERWQSARDLKDELEWMASRRASDRSRSPSRFGRYRGSRRACWRLSRRVSGFVPRDAARALKPLVRLDVDLGAGVSLGSQAGTDTIISPDGTRLVYVSQGKLFTRRMDQPKAIELAGTEGAYAPFFSPDGQWVAFFAAGKLKKISVEGGAAIALCDDSNAPRGGTWGEDGNIIAALCEQRRSIADSLCRRDSHASDRAGARRIHAALAADSARRKGSAIHLPAHRLLDSTGPISKSCLWRITAGKRCSAEALLAGTCLRQMGQATLFTSTKEPCLPCPSIPINWKCAARRRRCWRRSPTTLQAAPHSSIFRETERWCTAAAERREPNLVTVQWLDAAGKTQPLLAKPGVYQRPRLSPDGQRLALDDGSDIWVYEARRDTMTRLTFGGGTNIVPVWSPDGRYIAFNRAGGIWWVRSDGAGKPQLLIQSKSQPVPFSFTPDGKRLAYNEPNPDTAYDLGTVTIESDGAGLRAGKPEIFLQTSADERNPAFSPDGRWLAYASNESGTYQVYVRAFPDKGGKWQISNAGGVYPVWSGNGHELFFRTGDNRIMVATYAAKADSFVPDKPRVWSDKQLANLGTFGIATTILRRTANASPG